MKVAETACWGLANNDEIFGVEIAGQCSHFINDDISLPFHFIFT
jgi:hypothetical protein